jgi:hypothetical protein
VAALESPDSREILGGMSHGAPVRRRLTKNVTRLTKKLASES